MKISYHTPVCFILVLIVSTTIFPSSLKKSHEDNLWKRLRLQHLFAIQRSRILCKTTTDKTVQFISFIEEFSIKNGEWVSDVKMHFSYDDQNRIVAIYQHSSGERNFAELRCTYHYLENGKKITENIESKDSSAHSIYRSRRKSDYYFSDESTIASYFLPYFPLDMFTLNEKTHTAIDSMSTSVSSWNNMDSSWEKLSADVKTYYRYEDHCIREIKATELSDGSFARCAETIHAYTLNNDGSVDSVNTYKVNPSNGDLINVSHTTHRYENDRLALATLSPNPVNGGYITEFFEISYTKDGSIESYSHSEQTINEDSIVSSGKVVFHYTDQPNGIFRYASPTPCPNGIRTALRNGHLILYAADNISIKEMLLIDLHGRILQKFFGCTEKGGYDIPLWATGNNILRIRTADRNVFTLRVPILSL